MEMKFTYGSYAALIKLLKEHRYQITDYHSYRKYEKSVILRHDVDYDISKAVKFAQYEQSLGVCSTYFVLLSSDFYNLCSKIVFEAVQEIASCGHEIGLHFDETKYKAKNMSDMSKYIEKEVELMEKILQLPIKAVSMHRPSEEVLKADLKFPEIVNSYGKFFFEEFKYVSDSRMAWREDIFGIIQKEERKKLHILTHPFWYAEEEEETGEKLEQFLKEAYTERYISLNSNFRNLEEYVELEKE